MGFEAVEFESDGATLRGRLYLPASGNLFPAVVMAHGYSATIPMVLDRYAEAMQAAGVAALAYDHRGFGTSDGEPRHEINGWVQLRGYLDALAFARADPRLDTGRIAIWGDSGSGLVAIAAAALDQEVAALVVQVPACGRDVKTDIGPELLDAVRAHLASGRLRGPTDGWRSLPVVSADQTRVPSALEPLTAFRWFIEFGSRYGAGWANDVVLTRNPEAPIWDTPTLAAQVTCPTLFVMSPDDEMPGADSPVARATYERVRGTKELVEIDGGHFGLLYPGTPDFERATAAESGFLARVLGAG